jgi:hypothetical protein
MCGQVTEHMAGRLAFVIVRGAWQHLRSVKPASASAGCSRSFCSYTNLPFSRGFAEKPLVI